MRQTNTPALLLVGATDYDMVRSTIKIRPAGIKGCVGTHESVEQHRTRLREHGYLF